MSHWPLTPLTSSAHASSGIRGAVSKLKPGLSFVSLSAIAAALILLSCRATPQPDAQSAAPAQPSPHAFLGFDRNIYPGDDAMKSLRRDFAFTGYYLSPPPGEKASTWLGKREFVRSLGFGFIVLYRGREGREVNTYEPAVQKGIADARNAVSVAKSEGFPAQSILFLDIEEGGRLPETYHIYLRAWNSELRRLGFLPGLYCSGIPVNEGPKVTITTADNIRAHAPSKELAFVFFIFNDVCPPSPGCAFPQAPPPPATGGIPDVAVWQFAQSPRVKERTAHCAPGYHTDGNCYAPSDTAHSWFLDVDSATSADPSNGR
jgi:Domain of unknown function (DUF1906)